ncbi:MAG: extracellular solute-binding protein [Spirochaetes bacterium]|nr:extracellular solute-binding protein [Spirochaetota bacterium]
MKRTVTLLMCFVIFGVSFPLFAGGQKEGKKAPVTVTFFTGKSETVDWMDKLIADFNKKYPGIKVTQEFQKDASSVIKVKFASGDIPDITTVVNQDYIDQGMYMDLSNESWWSRILPSIKDLCTDIKSGKQYKVATNVTTAGIFYNKEVFNKLGLKEALTWKDFVGNLETIKKANPGMVPMFLAGKDSWTLGHLIEFLAHGIIKQEYGIMGSRKAFIYNQQDKLKFAQAGGPMDIFAGRIMELKAKGLINSDSLTATYDDQKTALATGKTALISQGMWAFRDIMKINPDAEIGFSPFPAIADGTKPVVISAEDSAYAITSASKHKKEAVIFLNYLFQPDNQKSYSEFLKMPSAFTDVNADWGPLKDDVKKALSIAVNIPFTETPSGFSGDDAGRMVQQLIAGKYATSLDFAKAYADTWNKAWNAAK